MALILSTEQIADTSRFWVLLSLQSVIGEDKRRHLLAYADELSAVLYTPVERNLVTVGRGSKRRKEVEETPLFRGYALAQLCAHHPPFGALLSPQGRAVGITGVVRQGDGYPARVPTRIVAHLAERDREGEFDNFGTRNGRPVDLLPDWLCAGSTVSVRETHKWLGGLSFVVAKVDERRRRVSLLPGDRLSAIPLHVGIGDVVEKL